jgi:hypothetical protein
MEERGAFRVDASQAAIAGPRRRRLAAIPTASGRVACHLTAIKVPPSLFG